MEPRRVVYTCMFGYSEAFNEFNYPREPATDFICFTDDPELRSSFWDMHFVPNGLLDPARSAKRIKHLPHRFLPSYDESLYVDNTVALKCASSEIFAQLATSPQATFMCFRHPWRRCVYDEATEILAFELDDRKVVEAQMALYRHLGYPPNNGLAKGTVLLRKHLDPGAMALGEEWNQQNLRYSVRDQLALNVVAWRQGFRLVHFDADILSNRFVQWPVVNGHRLPRDFDDLRYLELHPDVKAAGANPRRHYLLHGALEGRRYK